MIYMLVLAVVELTFFIDVPCHMTSCSAYKTGGKRRKRGTFRVMAFFFQVSIMCSRVLLSPCPGFGLIFTRNQEGTQLGWLTHTSQTNGVFNTM